MELPSEFIQGSFSISKSINSLISIKHFNGIVSSFIKICIVLYGNGDANVQQKYYQKYVPTQRVELQRVFGQML